jgi:hypothetical protein
VAIPPFNDNGWLPEGLHDCSLEEAAARFGAFQRSDRRPLLWTRLLEFAHDARACGLIEAIVVDGSFVTAEPVPNDIDLILVVLAHVDFSVDLLPAHYNLLSQWRVRRRLGFDIIVVKSGSAALDETVAFFQQVKQRPGKKKGLVRIRV